MAPDSESSHTFQKLKLDTKATHKPVASTFAAIPRDSRRNASVSSIVKPAERIEVDGYVYPNGGNTRQVEVHTNGNQLAPYDNGAAAVGDDIEANFRKRQTSISFDTEVTLDSGNRLSIEEPLPKSAIPESLPEVSDGEDFPNTTYIETPLDRRKHIQHHLSESRYPLLQPTIDEFATDSKYLDQDPVASLTSEATASPPLEEVQTPLDPSGDYLLSPIPATSPIEFPYSSSRRNGSQRSRSYRADLADGEGSMRRTSRRSSTRSGRSISSMSPAASFLSRYQSYDTPLKPTEPDDEGQGIGYDGEYIIGKQIGFGGFSVVKEVTTIENGARKVHAVKIVRKQLRDKSELENEQIQTQFDHEVEIWRFLRHPYILPLLRVYSTEYATFCITQLNKGGTLFDLIRDTHRKKKNGLPLHLVRRYSYQLASAIRYLHNDVMIVHRDIKLENCLLDMTAPSAEVEGGNILLCDFGMADFIVSDQRDGPEPHSVGANQNIGPADTSTSVAGSLQYAAPELFDASGPVFSTAADIWAYGVVVYTLLTAQLPFNEGLDIKTTMKIRRGEWNVELVRGADAFQQASANDAIDLVRGCLHMDFEKRWTVSDVLTCPLLSGCMQIYEHVNRSWLADS